jgi:hypothetical protein
MADLKLVVPVGGGTPPPTPPPSLIELVIGEEKFNINANGDALDSTGKVIKTKTEIETLKAANIKLPTEEEKIATTKLAEKTATITAQFVEGVEVEIDDKKYKLNKEGNAVDETGKVIKSKADLIALTLAQEEVEPELNYISEIQKATNITLLSDNGQPIAYENTLQGLAQREQDVFKEGSKIGRVQYEQELLGRFPILNSIIEHLTINGSLNGFTEDVDYSKIAIGDDEAQHIDIFTKAKLAQGMPKAEIDDLVKYYKEDKKLKGAAETGLTFLRTNQESKATTRATQVATAKAKQELEQTKYWNEVHSVLQTKKLNVNDKTFVIPEVIKIKDGDKVVTKTLKDFQDYIEKPLNFNIEGTIYTMTQLEYDEAVEDTKRTPHNDLFDAYRKFTKYDDAQLIAANVNSNTVKQVIKLTTKAGNGGSGVTPRTGQKLVIPIK